MSFAKTASRAFLSMLTVALVVIGATLCAPPTFAASSEIDATRDGLTRILRAQTIHERMRAVLQLSSAMHGQIGVLNEGRPWVAFETSTSALRGHYEILPLAIEVLQRRLTPPTDNYSYDADTVLAAQIVATVGGQRAVKEAIPVLLQTIAARSESEDFVTRWQMANCLVTLCGAEHAVSHVVKVIKTDSRPAVRAAAATTLGLSGRLLGNNEIEKLPDGSYRPLPAQANLHRNFQNAIPDLAKIASDDKSPEVRLAALKAIQQGIYGTQAVDWESAFSHLAHVLKDKTRSVEEHRASLRVLASAPANPRSTFSAVRSYVTDSDALSRGYAIAVLGHITKSGEQNQLTQWYINDLKSPSQRLQALRELEEACYVACGWAWTYYLPGELNYSGDSGLMDSSIRVPPSHSNEPLPAQRLVSALVDCGFDSSNKETRLRYAQLLLKIGTAYIGERNTSLSISPVPQGNDLSKSNWGRFDKVIIAALDDASVAIRSADPALAVKLQEQARRIGSPWIVV